MRNQLAAWSGYVLWGWVALIFLWFIWRIFGLALVDTIKLAWSLWGLEDEPDYVIRPAWQRGLWWCVWVIGEYIAAVADRWWAYRHGIEVA